MLAILAILSGVSIPTITATIRSVQLTSASNDLFAGLLMARSEAIKRNGRGVLCKSADGSTCATAGGWEQGWLVFHDANNNGARDPGEAIVQRTQALPAEMRVLGNLSVARYISYGANGATRFASGSFQAGTITLCRRSRGAVEARQIIISSSGRPRVQRTKLDECP